MNGEILIKARKVFVDDNIVENSEECPHCSLKGLQKKLRYFYLSLEEKIYKCENPNCLYPFERFIFKSLIDQTVYYYEEVVDGGRELFFRVPLDEQNELLLSNPLSTQLFCDNQRNPDIEDYNCDFSDLFNDFDDIDVESTQTKQSSSVENPDALEFLDDINAKSNGYDATHGRDENEITFDNIINEILNESPIEPPPPPSLPSSSSHFLSQTQCGTAENANCSTLNAKPKLLKCIQHLEKVKKGQSRKTSEKSKNSFTTAILEVRKNQPKLNGDSNTTKPEPENQKKSQRKQIPGPSSMAGFLKSANNLRPIDLARKLTTLKSLNTNSQFLREYMRAKEDKLFANEPGPETLNQTESEPIASTSSVLMKPNNDCLRAENPNQNVSLDPNTNPMTVFKKPTSVATPKKANPIRKPTVKKSIKKESSTITATTSKDCEEKKKPRKPRSKKANNVENATTDRNIEKNNHSQTTNLAVVVSQDSNDASVKTTAKKRVVSSKRKQIDEEKTIGSCSTSTEKLDQTKDVVIKTEPKKNTRKRKTSSAEADNSTSMENDKSGNIASTKRQRKFNNGAKKQQNEGGEIKPKRSRVTKPKVKPTAPLPLDDVGSDSHVKPVAEVKPNVDDSNTYSQSKIEISNAGYNRPQVYTYQSEFFNFAQKKEPAQKMTGQSMNEFTKTQMNSGLSKQPQKCILKAKMGEEKCELPSTSQNDTVMGTAIEHSTAVDLIATSSNAADELANSCQTAETIQQESVNAENLNISDDVFESTDVNNISISSNENKDEPKSKIEKSSIKKVGSTRQRKCRSDTDVKVKTEQNKDIKVKPKRGRTPKSEANPIKSEQSSLPSLQNDDGNDLHGQSDIDGGSRSSTKSALLGFDSQNVPIQEAKRNSTDNGEAFVHEPLKRPKKGALESKAKKQKCEKLSTLQKVTEMESTATQSTSTELYSCCTADTSTHEAIDAESSNSFIAVCETAKDKKQPNSTKNSNSKNVGSAKRQRESKCGNDNKPQKNEGVEVKPKRGRVTRAKANPVKTEKPSSPLLTVVDENGCQAKLKTEKLIESKTVPSNKPTPCHTAGIIQRKSNDTQSPNSSIAVCKTSEDEQPKSTIKPIKQYRSKRDTGDKPEQIINFGIEAKRSRATRSKANPTEPKQPSITLQLNDDVIEIGCDSLKQPKVECASESIVKKEVHQVPSTPNRIDLIMGTSVEDDAEDDLISILSGDSEPESNASCTIENIKSEHVNAESHDNYTNPIENANEQKPNSSYAAYSSESIQPKLEQMMEDAKIISDNYQNRTQHSNETSSHYYRRKKFKKEEEPSFQVDELLDEWGEGEGDCEHPKNSSEKDTPDINEPNDVDTISIASGTSDSSCGFVGEPFYNKQKPI